MAEVKLENVEKVFGGRVRAVSDLRLQVGDGELLVLVGPSGCGKTTVLRLIAGLEDLSGGSISIGTRVVDDLAPRDRNVAMVFQDYALYPHMTAFDNMAFGLRLRKVPETQIRGRVEEAAEILGLSGLLHRRPDALSGGQRQRVATGRAIVRKPAVFLFDEPLSHLDAQLRALMRVEICRLHARLGTTMIYVTHDQHEAMTMGDRIVVMRKGFAEQVAVPQTLYDHPANKFVAGFIGIPTMNFFEGAVEEQGGLLRFVAAGFSVPIPEARRSLFGVSLHRPVTLGVRPEHLCLAADNRLPDAPRVTATVKWVERTGAESYISLESGPAAFVARADRHRQLGVGSKVEVAVDIRKAHFFDARTEGALSGPAVT